MVDCSLNRELIEFLTLKFMALSISTVAMIKYDDHHMIRVNIVIVFGVAGLFSLPAVLVRFLFFISAASVQIWPFM